MPPRALDRLAEGLGEAAGAPVVLERPGNPEHGDYATNVALRIAPERRRPPRELAEELAVAAVALPGVERAEVAGPGFVNLFLESAWFGEALAEALAAGAVYGSGSASPPLRVQVEMVSANPTGPVTVASARNGALGDSVARLLAFAGNEVEREYYYNDTGAQMDRFRESVEARRRGEEPPEDGYLGAYVDELALEPGDPVPRMLASIEATLERFRIQFDTWERQSIVEAEIPEVLAAIETYEADGATWAPTSKYGDDKDRVVIRSDGSYTYYAADLAYARNKLARGFDRAVYVLGADHHGYVGRLKAAAGLLGEDPERIEALVYQLVHLTRGGAATKMSKRRGNVVFLDELIDEIGVDAARWYLANRGPDQAIEIDIDLAAEKSQKNPVYYVQYAHARIAGILRNAEGARADAAPPPALEAEERELVKRIVEFPAIAAEAAERRSPQAIPNYAIRLADDFHRFYHDHKVLGGEAEAFRLGLCEATRAVTARCLDLVGVEAPRPDVVRWNLYVAALAASWGVISVIVAHVDLSATVLVFWRVAIAAVTVTIACSVVGRADLLRLPEQRGLMVAVGVVLAVHWYLFFETIKLSSVAVAVLTVYTAPVFLALLAPLFLPEQRSRVALVALVPAALGLVLMSTWGSGGTHARPLAIVCGIGAALTYALLVIGTKRLRSRMGPVTITAWSYGIAALALAPFLAGAGQVVPTGSELFYVLLLGVVFTALSGYLYVTLLGHVTAQAVGILAYLEPVSAAVLAWALLGQPLGRQVLVGGALVVGAGVVIVLREPVETEVRIAG